MRTKDDRELAPGSRVMLYYIDEEENVKSLWAYISNDGHTSYGPSGVPLEVRRCYACKVKAFEQAIELVGNTINMLEAKRQELDRLMTFEIKLLEGSP